MKKLKIEQYLPNIKNWSNTATKVLRDLIKKHNKLVEEFEELKTGNVKQPSNSNNTVSNNFNLKVAKCDCCNGSGKIRVKDSKEDVTSLHYTVECHICDGTGVNIYKIDEQ